MKKSVKILSVLMCAVIAACCFTSLCFAAPGMNYVVLGDSIGYGAGISNPGEAVYGKIIANTNSYNYSNFAQNGNETSDLLNKLRSNSSVIESVKNADIISISIGGNNFLHANMTDLMAKGMEGDFSEIERIVAGVRTDFDAIISKIKEYNSSAVILMQTLYNPLQDSDVGNVVYEKGTGMLNQVFKDYAAAHPGEIEIVDVAAAFKGKKGLISWDNIHPSAEGNYVIARAVQAKLYELGLADTNEIVIKTKGLDWIPGGQQTFVQKIIDFFTKLINFFKNLFR